MTHFRDSPRPPAHAFPARRAPLSISLGVAAPPQTRRDGQKGQEREERPWGGEDGRQDGEEGVQALAEGGGERGPPGRAPVPASSYARAVVLLSAVILRPVSSPLPGFVLPGVGGARS